MRSQRGAPERLEDSNVEDFVDACALRKRQTVRDIADVLSDLERPGELWAQLAPRSRQQRLNWTVKDAQPYPIANSKL